MLVKKTKTGKFSILMSHDLRELLFGAICNICEDQSVKLMSCKLKTEQDVLATLHLSVLEEIITSKNFALQAICNTRIILKRSEAVAIMWLLRYYDNEIPLLVLKSSLHKSLC